MKRLLLLSPAELTRDNRVRRAAVAGLERGYDVVGLCGQISGLDPIPLAGVTVIRVGPKGQPHRLWQLGFGPSRPQPRALRELRALVRLARLLPRTVSLWRRGRGLGTFDVVHAHDLDTLPVASLLARRQRARLVYDAHELYSAFESPSPRLATSLTRQLEGILARRADAVVTVSAPLAAELHRLLRLPRPPYVVLNAPNRADFPLRHFDDGPLRAIYQGGLGPGRELTTLLWAAEARGVVLTLRISLADTEALRAAVASQRLEKRVHVAEPVTPDQAVAALRDFEAGIIFDLPQSRNIELSSPNKLFEYLMAGLAVVAPRLEGLASLIEGEGVGIVYDAGRPEALPAALETLAADRRELSAMRRRARRLALERLNAETAAEVLAEAWGSAGDG